MSKNRKLLCAAAFAVAGFTGLPSAAFAGEVTGNGKSLKQEDGSLHGRSACAFSGQEDGQFLEPGDPEYSEAHAQSWGQIPKAVRDQIAGFGFHPGSACNPNVGPPPEP